MKREDGPKQSNFSYFTTSPKSKEKPEQKQTTGAHTHSQQAARSKSIEQVLLLSILTWPHHPGMELPLLSLSASQLVLYSHCWDIVQPTLPLIPSIYL